MDILVDLETLGTRAGSVIATIGAAAIVKDGDTITSPTTADRDLVFYTRINQQDCLNLGMTVDAATLSWWMTTPCDAARRELFSSDLSRSNLHQALVDFAQWVKARRYDAENYHDDPEFHIWGNGPSFDLGLLEDAYWRVYRTDTAQPWQFREERCFRTLRTVDRMLPGEPVAKYDPLIPHHALHDALAEAKALAAMLQRIRERSH